MKKFYILALTSIFCFTANVKAEEGTSNATVKMTYVNMDDPDKSYGEIAEGETAETGYNKISGGKVEFANTGWGVNYITYLQVDASKIEGNITSATLSFEGSGSVNGSRTICYGVGYNSSEWSKDMTYNGADRNITEIAETKWTTSKSGSSFDTLSFDITEAIKKTETGIATILIYSITNAGGGYVKNPKVEVSWTTEATYKITFKETNSIEATVTVDGKDVTKGADFADGTYTFKATAPGYQEYTGEFKVEGKDLNVEFTMNPNPTLSYTVKNNVNDDVKTGTCLEGLNVTVPYSRYILAEDNVVWKKDATNKEYNYTFTPDADNCEAIIEYSETVITDGIWFAEAEDIKGLTPTTSGQIAVRGSNAAGAYAAEAVEVYTLKPGTYKIEIAVAGNAGAEIILKVGEVEIKAQTNGSWTPTTSEEFTIETETALTVQGGGSEKPLDYILITGEADVESAVDSVEAAKAEGKWFNIQGIQVAEPTAPGLYIHNGKKIIVK